MSPFLKAYLLRFWTFIYLSYKNEVDKPDQTRLDQTQPLQLLPLTSVLISLQNVFLRPQQQPLLMDFYNYKKNDPRNNPEICIPRKPPNPSRLRFLLEMKLISRQMEQSVP